MNTNMSTRENPRREELLADRALVGLTSAEHAELKQLGDDQDLAVSLESTAAALDLALGPVEFEPLPPFLRAQIERQAVAMRFQSLPRLPRSQRPWLLGLGSLAAAASVGVAVWLGVRSIVFNVDFASDVKHISWQVPEPAADPKPIRVWDAVARLERVVELPSPSKSARKVATVMGEVVWSDIRQEGYLRLKGLPINDPSRSQYQLWIFDPKRDARFPVDGGVFDMTTGPNGETTVPIRARLQVDHATLFAVTEEVPGGVVVSDRSRLLAVAARTNP